MGQAHRLCGVLVILLIGCQGKDLPDINVCNNPPVLQLGSVRHPQSCLQPDGKIEVMAADGSGVLTFMCNGLSSQHSGVFEDLPAGKYTITVTDRKNCSDTLGVELINGTSSLVAIAVTQPNSECLSFNGSVIIQAMEGLPPYQYSFNGGPFSSIAEYGNLRQGIYSITTKDAAGCLFEVSAEVPRKSTDVSWGSEVKPVIMARCAKGGCHDGSSGRPALNTYKDVYNLRNQIKSRVASGSMPFDGPLPPDQKAKILCWLEDGAPDN